MYTLFFQKTDFLQGICVGSMWMWWYSKVKKKEKHWFMSWFYKRSQYFVCFDRECVMYVASFKHIKTKDPSIKRHWENNVGMGCCEMKHTPWIPVFFKILQNHLTNRAVDWITDSLKVLVCRFNSRSHQKPTANIQFRHALCEVMHVIISDTNAHKMWTKMLVTVFALFLFFWFQKIYSD